MPPEEPLAERLLIALAAALWALLVPGEAAHLMTHPLRCPERLRFHRLPRPAHRIASASALTEGAVAPDPR